MSARARATLPALQRSQTPAYGSRSPGRQRLTSAALPGPSHAQVVVDVDVLEEIRGMRVDIKQLSERLSMAATRDDLAGYVTREAFDAHLAAHTGGLDTRRWWATYGLTVAALFVSPLLYLLFTHISLAVR